MPYASDNPRVSVIVTTHNRAGLLPRAVHSVLAQDFHDYELIIVDDCSTDDTSDVIRGFSDPRISPKRRLENGGAPAAKNTGIWTSRGEYLAFLDDDDEWTADKLSRQVRALDDAGPDVALAYTWFDYVDAEGERRAGGRCVASGDGVKDVLALEPAPPAPTSTYMVRAAAAHRIRGFDEALGGTEDWDFMSRIAELWDVAAVPEVLMLMHEGHPRSGQWARADERHARFLWTRVERYDRRLRERPAAYARMLRELAVAEMRSGNARGAAKAYARALTVDPPDTLRATAENAGFAAGLLWRRVLRGRFPRARE